MMMPKHVSLLKTDKKKKIKTCVSLLCTYLRACQPPSGVSARIFPRTQHVLQPTQIQYVSMSIRKLQFLIKFTHQFQETRKKGYLLVVLCENTSFSCWINKCFYFLEIVEIINQQLGLISISRHASKRNFISRIIAIGSKIPIGSKIEALKGLVAMHYKYIV